MMEERSGIQDYVGREVIFDTSGPLMFLGTLAECCPDGFWLENADIRDRTEGHVTKERYACEAKKHGIRANRSRIFVFRDIVVSCSGLDEIISD